MRVDAQRRSGMPFNTKMLIERDDSEQTLIAYLDSESFPEETVGLIRQLLEVAVSGSTMSAGASLRPVAG